MLGAFHARIHGRAEHHPGSVESALLTAGALILTLLTLVILFFVVFATRAS
ncbi:MAG TPA: hypothetical protein VGS58_17880 [Candidatus Sulfopaludibacter sp.]|nr:hypothetical protein [Candidatus Sulfopaludibacter sp.]